MSHDTRVDACVHFNNKMRKNARILFKKIKCVKMRAFYSVFYDSEENDIRHHGMHGSTIRYAVLRTASPVKANP